ncbi:beta-N-acetylhexosaminidase [Palleronia aestuarii]|uniref:beta-N-acetylhexosaminidase n=1 Tax=Palleronia aestuarii TaxID=568105 RepID=A0A2W7NCY0_9RHOB|nr:glycoside hydrolase family 3 N-terminal domain-containing protein [Palleronia aestuarii]PZX16007.1 beta-N-acetylhexosaminidase [Palleronia aestuarii]
MTQAAILGCEGVDLSPDEAAFLAGIDPFGIILFARNISTPDRLRRLTGDLRDALGRDVPILVDQEGGRVQRLAAPHWRAWQPPLDHVAKSSDPERAIWIRARLIAAELHEVGIDVNCIPTADVAREETHPFLRNRCYGTDPDRVAALGRATAQGLLAGGILPVMKHMPGHGRGRADSHYDLPVIDAPAEALEEDFAPFRALADLPMGMTAHIVVSAFGKHPATQDPALITLIRERIGFDGLLMSDDLSMEALGGTLAERTAAAIGAGCDIALAGHGDRSEKEACAAAAGPMTAEATRRAEAALSKRTPPEPADLDALEAELAALMDGPVYA